MMKRLGLAELERRCQKPEHRRVGNWMARRVARPLALRVTWLVSPWGVSANAATLLAWAVGLAAAAGFAWGSPTGWLLGAMLLQLWYLLDHVDGQLARLRGTASLDGMQLDYLMHHTVHPAISLGVGHGLFAAMNQPEWLWIGAIWGMAGSLVSLHHDTRYKTFVTRLKRVRGVLEACGGAERPCPQPPMPRRPAKLAAWFVRKACEMHVVMNSLGAVAVASWLLNDRRLGLGGFYMAIMAVAASSVAVFTLVRSVRGGLAEREWAAWFQASAGSRLVEREGWWIVEPTGRAEDAQEGHSGRPEQAKAA